MFKVNGNTLLAEEIEILIELRAQLAINGVELFREFKKSGNNIQFPCPVHNHGQERKPSCGISTKDVKRPTGEIIPAGTVHCFACGYTATLDEMVSYCFGKDDEGHFGKTWLVKNFLSISVESRSSIELNLDRGASRVKKINYVSEEELETYRYYNEYMYKRKMTNEVIDMFDVGYDDCFKMLNDKKEVVRISKCITLPVRDITGGTLFIGRRSVTDKMFHYPEGVDKPVYGLYELDQYAPADTKEIIICESAINAITCWVYGKPAVALLGTGTDLQYRQLASLPYRKFITALDPDEAGQLGTQKIKNKLGKNKLVSNYSIPVNKDINDLTKEEFENLEEFF